MGVMATGPGTGLATFFVKLLCRHEWEVATQAETLKNAIGPRAPIACGYRIEKFRCRKCGAVNVKRIPMEKPVGD
jgi:hypothetical protein